MGSDDGRVVILHLPCKLACAWEDYDAANDGSDQLQADHDKICFKPEKIRSIFEPVVSQVLALIEGQLQSVPGCKAILAVGGFAQSPYVMKRIRQAFGHRVPNITSPPDPGAAICQGAVLCGLDPGIIISRVSWKTYGVRIYYPFNRNKHPLSKLVHAGGKAYCADVFSKFVEIDQEVGVDEKVSRTYYTMYPNQEVVTFTLHCSDEKDPAYTTDPGVSEVGIFSLNLVNGCYNIGKDLECTIRFGRTLVEVSATTVNLSGGDLETAQSFTFSSSSQ